MEIIDAIVLGTIQGLTEFLPVSSSGHLEIGKAILGRENIPQESLMITVVLHFATAISTLVVFRKDAADFITGILNFEWNEETQLSCKVLLSMLPAAFIGLFFDEELEAMFSGNLALVGFMLLITALLLWTANRAGNTQKKVGFRNAFVIGVAQAIAMLPGISRSGATISTSVLLGNDKNKAARFSFLMVVPLIFGKIILDLFSGEMTATTTKPEVLVTAFLAAFIVGIAACTWMIQLVEKSKLSYFAIYCFVAGTAAILFANAGA